MDSTALETVLRRELRAAGTRWSLAYKQMGDDERKRLLGHLLTWRLVSEETDRQCRIKDSQPDPDVKQLDPELAGTQGALGNGAGGGRRIIRGTNSLT